MQNLLTQTILISRRHEEIARLNGSNFNLFGILGVGQLEVSTHSAFLCDLLNPNGSHGQGDVFLRKFLQLDTVHAPNLNPETTTVHTEYYIGGVTETSGGRIDILLEDGQKNRIVIENKIYAADQPNWIRRYLHFLKCTPEDFTSNNETQKTSSLYYLTLFGSDPTSADKCEKSAVHLLSYHTDIIDWLKECRKEAVETPLVRESITQYIHLLQALTGQNPNQKMNDQIAELALKDADNFEAAHLLFESQKAIYSSLILKLKSQL